MSNSQLNVGVLASEMERSPTGVGRFLRGLLGAVGKCRPEWRFQLFFQGDSFEDSLFSDPALEPVFLGRPDSNQVLFEQFRLARRLPDLDVFFAPAYSLPGGLRCPSLVAIHDLSFEVLPEEFRWKERWRRRWLARRAARKASRVLTISPIVAGQLRRLYGVEKERIGLLPLAVDLDVFRPAPESSEHPVSGPYVVFAGSVFPRRRLDVVLEAFALLVRSRPGLRMVLAGANRLARPEDLGDWIHHLGLEDRVEELGYVDDARLVQLLRNAELSFYLSTYEGYGLPPLESLAVGTVAVTSPGLALDYLWPEYPYRCSAIDAEEVARMAGRVLDDVSERDRVLADARGRVRNLSWSKTAEVFAQEIEKAVA